MLKKKQTTKNKTNDQVKLSRENKIHLKSKKSTKKYNPILSFLAGGEGRVEPK